MQDGEKSSPPDKPLPLPPVIQVDTSSPVKATITLIDATEKPLRRSPAGVGQEENWPVLRPQRAPSVGTLRDKMRETGTELIKQASAANLERYPRLGNVAGGPPNGQQKPPVSSSSPTCKAPRDEVSESYLRNAPKAAEAGIADPFQDINSNTSKTDGCHDSVVPSQLSSSAAALKKSTFQEFTGVRQTRTSSLRARLSAGEIVSNRTSKVTGFTDFTAEPVVGYAHRESPSLRKAGQAQASSGTGALPARSSSLTVPNLNTKASKESINNRPPAKFIAGSRRPATSHRPGSRGSLHDDSRPISTTAPTRLSNRNAPLSSMKGDGHSKKGLVGAEGRRSSIPIPKSLNDTCIQSSIGNSMDEAMSNEAVEKNLSRTASGKADRQASSAIPDATSRIGLSTTDLGYEASAAVETEEAYGLEAIDESPRHAYTFRRLSTKSPEFGPTLAISPSADKYIMGLDEDKENLSLMKKQSKEFKSKRAPSKAFIKKQSERPSSSHGLPSPRLNQIDPNIREKKSRSVDMSSVKKTTNYLSKNSSVTTTTTTTSSASDPFYDASEDIQPETSATPRTSGNSAANVEAISTSTDGDDVDKAGGERAVPAKMAPGKLYEIDQPTATSITTDEYDPFKYDNVPVRNHVADVRISSPGMSASEPITPVQVQQNTAPSRKPLEDGTSRPDNPSINAKVSETSIHTNLKERGPPTPPKDFSDRQNNLGFSRGHASSQVNLLSTTKRGSAAPESLESKGSLPTSTSKSRFNLKGLFHKRSTDNDDNNMVKSKRKTKGKIAINGNGSPFPPINEIYPIHRPTLASSNRSQGPTPRSSVRLSHNLTTAHRPNTPHTPHFTSHSPMPNELSRTTNVAMSLLESARREQSSPKKEKLLALGKVVVDVITQARDAEKAVEECKLALGRAEKAREACYKAVGEVGGMVEAVRRVEGRI